MIFVLSFSLFLDSSQLIGPKRVATRISRDNTATAPIYKTMSQTLLQFQVKNKTSETHFDRSQKNLKFRQSKPDQKVLMEAPWALTRPLITILTRLLSPQIKYLPLLLHQTHHSSSSSIFNDSNQKINVLKNAISRES